MSRLCLNRLSDDWKDVSENGLIVYGLGIVGRRNLKKIKEDFYIPFIVDNSGKCLEYNGMPVKTLKDARGEISAYKIVIMGTAKVYRSIAATLEEIGLREYLDYCSIEQFYAEWYWKYKREVCLLQIDVAVTLRCTLKCKDCNMFVPYHKAKTDFSYEELKSNFDDLFCHVDYLSSCVLLGGEPLLNKDLGRLISYLGTTYGKKIGQLSIISNGTLLPERNLLDIIKEFNVEINLSDYTQTVPYKKRFLEAVDCYEKHGITVQIKKDLIWGEFGFPVSPCQFDNSEEHMKSCSPLWRGLNSSKYYYCNVAWSAGRLHRFEENEKDYVNLKGEIDKETLLEYSLGNIKGGLTCCRYCGGFGEDNKKLVQAGLQIDKEETENAKQL